MLNRRYILLKLEKYLNDAREISAEEFEFLFSSLEKKEQYEVIDIMIDAGIEYVDEKNTLEDVGSAIDQRTVTYSQNINDYSALSSAALCKLYQEGNEIALEALLAKNQRFVYAKAKSAMRRYPGSTLEIDDIIQEGMLGLVDAARRFDVSNDNAFLTYASYWVQQRISRAIIDTGYIIRLPVHVYEKIVKITKLRSRYPLLSKAELIDKLSEDGDSWSVTATEFEKYLNYSDLYLHTESLNALVGDDGDIELIDLIPDEKQLTPDIIAENAERSAALEKTLSSLTPREKIVIELRYGLVDGRQHTLEEIGKRYGVTRERIRQIESKALRKLRHPKRAKNLRPFLEE